MSQHTDPRKSFYVAVPVGNADGTLDLECEGLTTYETEAEAVAAAEEEVDENGGEFFVYLATPICRVHRISIQIERLDRIKP